MLVLSSEIVYRDSSSTSTSSANVTYRLMLLLLWLLRLLWLMNYDLLLLSAIYFRALLKSKLYSIGDTTVSFGMRLSAALIRVWENDVAGAGLTDAVYRGYVTGITATVLNSSRTYWYLTPLCLVIFPSCFISWCCYIDNYWDVNMSWK